MKIFKTASLGSNFNGSDEKKEWKELRYWMFLTQAASCGFVWEFQTFVSMNIWLNVFKNANYLIVNSLWHSKNLNKSFVFKTRPDIGETFKRTKDYFKKSWRKMIWKLVQILEKILMIPLILNRFLHFFNS